MAGFRFVGGEAVPIIITVTLWRDICVVWIIIGLPDPDFRDRMFVLQPGCPWPVGVQRETNAHNLRQTTTRKERELGGGSW